jgi:hypothetical protein
MTITFRDGAKLVHTITQAGASTCTFTLTPSEVRLPITGGSASFEVAINGGCAWDVVSSSLFGVSINAIERNGNAGRVHYTVPPYLFPSNTRAEYIDVKDSSGVNPSSRFWIMIDGRPDFLTGGGR